MTSCPTVQLLHKAAFCDHQTKQNQVQAVTTEPWIRWENSESG